MSTTTQQTPETASPFNRWLELSVGCATYEAESRLYPPSTSVGQAAGGMYLARVIAESEVLNRATVVHVTHDDLPLIQQMNRILTPEEMSGLMLNLGQDNKANTPKDRPIFDKAWFALVVPATSPDSAPIVLAAVGVHYATHGSPAPDFSNPLNRSGAWITDDDTHMFMAGAIARFDIAQHLAKGYENLVLPDDLRYATMPAALEALKQALDKNPSPHRVRKVKIIEVIKPSEKLSDWLALSGQFAHLQALEKTNAGYKQVADFLSGGRTSYINDIALASQLVLGRAALYQTNEAGSLVPAGTAGDTTGAFVLAVPKDENGGLQPVAQLRLEAKESGAGTIYSFADVQDVLIELPTHSSAGKTPQASMVGASQKLATLVTQHLQAQQPQADVTITIPLDSVERRYPNLKHYFNHPDTVAYHGIQHLAALDDEPMAQTVWACGARVERITGFGSDRQFGVNATFTLPAHPAARNRLQNAFTEASKGNKTAMLPLFAADLTRDAQTYVSKGGIVLQNRRNTPG